jgi:2-hydroxy-3-oxopropionate reductase
MPASLPKIALLGTGLMGFPMAQNIAKAGFALSVWNRTLSKAEPLSAVGARVCDAAAAAVAEADIIITMLENGPVVEALLFEAGVAAAAKPGALFIDMSSIPPATARRIAARLRDMGKRAIDAPVSGGTVGAAQATLAIMAGGTVEDVDEARPMFEAMGRITRVGPNGSGQLAKLANQAIVAITIGAVSEALLLAAAGGADPAAVRQAIRGGFAESRILELHGRRMIERDFVPGGPVHLQVKDLDTILATAAEEGLDLPLVKDVRARFAQLRDDLGGAMLDHSALLLQLESINQPHKVGG